MVESLLHVFLLPVTAAAAVLLVRSALRHWWAERAGRAYELPENRMGTALRAGAAGAAVAAVIATAFLMPPGGGSRDVAPGSASGAVKPAAAPPEDAGHRPSASASPSVSRPASASASVSASSGRSPSRSATPKTTASTRPAQTARTIGHPARGTLQELADGTRVWLPPAYAYPRAADLDFPVVVVHGLADDPDLFAGFAAQAERRLADPFLVVLPRDCAPERDPAALLDTVARHYRTVPGRSARAVLGIGGQAACAVREAIAHPDRYRVGVGVGVCGTYPAMPAPGASPRFDLLLATASGDEAARTSALRLRDALRLAPGEVRLLDGIAPRRHLFGLIAGYFTEKLVGPAR